MLEPRCSICKEIKREILKDGSSKLERRLYNCSKFVKGGETQKSIASEYGFSEVSMVNHLKYHQNPDSTILANQKFERNLETKATTHSEVRDAIMEQGMEDLKEGKMQIKASDLRAAAKDAADLEERQKDRNLAIAEMMYGYLAGEYENPTRRVEEGPRRIEE